MRSRGDSRRRRRQGRTAATFVAVMGLVSACGSGGLANPTSEPSSESTPSIAASPSSPAGVVSVSLHEMNLLVSSESAPAGEVTFEVRNAGSLPHELVVIRTDLDAAELPVDGVKVVEQDLDIVARSQVVPAGQEAALAVELEPGHYVLFCNLSGHYEQSQYGPGMKTNFDVQ